MNYLNSVAKAKAIYVASGTATAGGSGDNVKVSGACIDIQPYNAGKLVLTYKTTLAASQTLSFAVEYNQVDTDNTPFETPVEIYPKTVVQTGAGTKTGTLEIDLNLASKKRFFGVNITPDLSATGTDTVIWAAALIAADADVANITGSVV